MVRQIGPVMIQQRDAVNVVVKDIYKLKSVTTDIDVNVVIPVGGNGEVITISSEGHIYPNHKRGDVATTLNQVKHNLFTRNGSDLAMTHRLTLKEAVCGYKIAINHASGHNLMISSKKGETVQQGQLKCALNWVCQ